VTVVKPVKSPSLGQKRRAARLAAVQALYAMELGGHDAAHATAMALAGGRGEAAAPAAADRELCADLVRGTAARQADLDAALAPCLGGRSLARLEILLRCILRAATWELIARPDIDAPLSIAEYVAVADVFFTGREPQLVNAILDQVARTARRDPGLLTGAGEPALPPRETPASAPEPALAAEEPD